MGKVIYYNILRDGDNTLKGLIAEKIFERVVRHFIDSLQCCSTLALALFLSRIRDASKFPSHRVHLDLDLETVVSRYGAEGTLENELVETLKGSRRYVGLSERDIDPQTVIRYDLHGCPLCLRDRDVFHEDEEMESNLVMADDLSILVRLCSTCYKYLAENGYITHRRIQDKKLVRLFCTLKLLWELYSNRDIIRILARLDKEDRELLLDIYARPGQLGGRPFDYLCIDERGDKYLVDVASTAGSHRASPLSKRERELAPVVRARGFKISTPVVEYLGNWNVRVGLMEI